MPHYENILIDVDDTLLDFVRAEREAFIKVCAFLQIPYSEALNTHYHNVNIHYWQLHEKGLAEKKDFLPLRFSESFQDFGYQIDGAEANRQYTDFLGEGSYPLPDAVEVLKTLHDRSRVWLVTNGNESVQRRRIEVSPIRHYVEGAFISDCIGFQKPSREFFDEVFRTVPYSAKRTVIIGDSLTSDIRGGKNAGIDSIWYNPAGKPNDHPDIRPTYEIRDLKELPDICL